MEKYYIISLSEKDLDYDLLEAEAHSNFKCTGVEFFSIDEARVDEILGERSYSGGDVPESVIFEVESTVENGSSGRKFYFNSMSDAKSFGTFLKTMGISEFKLDEFESEDWNTKWRESFQTIEVSNSFKIIPSWDREKHLNDDGFNVFIYPGMGFGTGNHETTFLCLKLFEEIYSGDKRIDSGLDFGCGSGILGIALYLKRSCPVDMYDIDKDALENCKQNLELNEIALSELPMYLPKQREKINKKYDLVFANILQSVLLQEANYLAMSLNDGGKLILSGLLKGQENEVIKKYCEINPKLNFVKKLTKGDWVALQMDQNR